ncbi:MAG: NnrS family protein [Rhodobacteraceae bacterium]|nr:NnrS family protein [Paracoccaceae bacterium]
MTSTAEQMRRWQGPAVLTVGFRLFFLAAGIWAFLAMVLWIVMLSGAAPLPVAFDAVSWHAHEFLWGYTSAVITGFLLTAVPNWTGRLPVVGWPVAGLAAIWLAGRIAMALSGWLPGLLVALVDLSFLAALVLVLTREIVAGKSWRNLKVVGLVGVFLLGNAIFHLEFLREGSAASGFGLRFGLGATILLILVIGGRVTPSFTRNWFVKQGRPERPAATIGPVDQVALGLAVAAIGFWAVLPHAMLSAVLCLLAGLANLFRLARWSGHRTFSEPLVTILHVGYGLAALGFVSVGLAGLGLGQAIAAQHVWMVGAIATMTLAMMTRASLGHAGLPLTASPGVSAVYVAIVGATLARFLAGVTPWYDPMIWLSGALWLASFGGFVAIYWPILARAPQRARG